MSARLGWLLAALAFVGGYLSYGWPGLLLAFSVVVFWLLLQFSRSLRTLRQASQAPVGSVGSAVMLHSKLHAGMTLMQILPLAGSLGRRVSETPEVWAWADASGSQLQLRMQGGRLVHWELSREPAPQAQPPAAP